MLISEVKMLLEHRKAQHESQDDDQELSEVRLLCFEKSVVTEGKELISNWPIKNEKHVSFMESDWPIQY